MAILPMEPDLVAQIKAGEVIERPASVVKELIENSLDAGAGRIRIDIEQGGLDLIRVVDNGTGIPPEDLELAFAEHTSSKLHSPEDLNHIETLGFRGEALYAISNVARVEAISGAGAGGVTRRVVFDHGSLVCNEPAAGAGGTRFSIHRLFAGVPARRKHLRGARSEGAAVHQVVARYVIAHPEASITLASDSRTVLASPGSGLIGEAFGSVYGLDLVHKMVALDHPGEFAVAGLVSPPDVTRPNRTAIHIFVNGRPVKSAALAFAIEDAFSGLLMVGRHPLAAVAIAVPPEQLDPNVHPAKLEVRFLADRPVFSAVRAAVSRALASGSHVIEARDSFGGEPAATPGFASGLPESPRVPYPESVSFGAPQEALPRPPTLEHALPMLRVFGQAAQTFIVAEGPAGLYMIDQHAAHERVLFDALSARDSEPDRQSLLEPLTVEIGPDQIAALETHGAELTALGFEVELFGELSCLVRAVPLMAGRPLAPAVITEVLDALGETRSPDGIMNGAVTVVSCRGAVKAGQTLTMEEMRELVRSLERTPNPRSCPHGRPTIIHISTERLEREFGRR